LAETWGSQGELNAAVVTPDLWSNVHLSRNRRREKGHQGCPEVSFALRPLYISINHLQKLISKE
jgi:hypothetical protein